MNKEQRNILYGLLKDVTLIEMVFENYEMDLESVKKVKEQIENKLKESSC